RWTRPSSPPDRKSAPSAPTESPRRQSSAIRRRSPSESCRPSASKRRKSFPPPPILTNRVGSAIAFAILPPLCALIVRSGRPPCHFQKSRPPCHSEEAKRGGILVVEYG